MFYSPGQAQIWRQVVEIHLLIEKAELKPTGKGQHNRSLAGFFLTNLGVSAPGTPQTQLAIHTGQFITPHLALHGTIVLSEINGENLTELTQNASWMD